MSTVGTGGSRDIAKVEEMSQRIKAEKIRRTKRKMDTVVEEVKIEVLKERGLMKFQRTERAAREKRIHRVF